MVARIAKSAAIPSKTPFHVNADLRAAPGRGSPSKILATPRQYFWRRAIIKTFYFISLELLLARVTLQRREIRPASRTRDP
jgi:hypothetical protein